MKTTPPSEMFQELREINRFILDLIATPGTVRWHWPTYYLLYVDMDRMAWQIGRTADSLAAAPLLSLSETDGGLSPQERTEWIDEAFAELKTRQQSIVHHLFKISWSALSAIDDVGVRRRLRAHVHPKGAWYQALMSDYCPGKVSADGERLERVIVLTDPAPPERIEDLEGKGLLRRQCLDIGSAEARFALAAAIRETASGHGEVMAAMMQFFLAHCTLQDLVHPSSA